LKHCCYFWFLCDSIVFSQKLRIKRIPKGPIKHYVVLMLENRSFDHMLGHLKKLNPNIDGADTKMTNPIDPSNPKLGKVNITFDAAFDIEMNPDHSVYGTACEIWGSQTFTDPAPMNGFVYRESNSQSIDQAKKIMRCYNESMVSAISTLAQEFTVIDKWFASLPGPTEPNRMYLYSATSHGSCTNNVLDLIEGYPQRAIWDDVYDSGYDFRIYYGDFPVVLTMKTMRDYPDHIKDMYTFIDDCATGNLKEYTYIEPRWFDFLFWKENDQHPHSYTSTLYGEFLYKEIYDNLRKSPVFENTMIVVMYDEHGGLPDHVSPPQKNVPNPDGLNCSEFNFDRLGVRVPAIIASPWVDKGVVIHHPKKKFL